MPPLTFTAAQVFAFYKVLSQIQPPDSAEELATCPDLLCPLPAALDNDEGNGQGEDDDAEEEEEEEDDDDDHGNQRAKAPAPQQRGSAGRQPKARQQQQQQHDIKKGGKAGGGSSSGGGDRRAVPAMKLKLHRAALDGAWVAFLHLGHGKGLPRSLVREVLFSMPTLVLPRLEHPLKLADFMTAALDFGGMVGVVAIHGLFLLVNEHGLDYPDLYERL